MSRTMPETTLPRPDWMTQSRCAEVGIDLFFAEYSGDKHARRAKKICEVCEVKDMCLEYALGVPPLDDFGVWGGTTEVERKLIRAERRGTEEVDADFDIRDLLEPEPEPVKYLDLTYDEFERDEAAEEAALEAEIERQLRAA